MKLRELLISCSTRAKYPFHIAPKRDHSHAVTLLIALGAGMVAE
jgi:hypothetical protein